MRKIAYIFICFCFCFCVCMSVVSCQQKGKTEKDAAAAGAGTNAGTNAGVANGGSVGSVANGGVNGGAGEDTDGLTSKGNIISEHDIPVYGMVSEVIKQRYVKEGMHVGKGQVMFLLDQTMHQSDIDKVRREIEQARFQYQSILVGQGYDIDHPDKIPAKMKAIARTRSSLNLYEQELRQQELLTAYYTIKAPASGIVTDVTAFQYDLAEKGKELCHIVDTEHLQVTFSILENEISSFLRGATVHFSTIAFPSVTYSATVTEVSPKVDENGMVKIKANINHGAHYSDLKVGMTAIVMK